jgi:ribosome assembly protein YihI (activator of Der GTPase)
MQMSAYLDKSQGITFVYSNIFELYQKAKNSKLDAPFTAERSRVIKKGQEKVEEFQVRQLDAPVGERPFPVPMGVREAEEKAARQNMRPVASLQKNLSELTDAHEKLRFLLQELEALTKKK